MSTVVYVTNAGAVWWEKNQQGWITVEAANHDVTQPVWVVTDLGEETFSELAVPRIFGSDRTGFVNRQLSNRFPDSLFRIALPPAQVGGLMDRLAPPSQTLTAIEPSDRVELAIAKIKAPVAGVWSASMLMARIGQRAGMPLNMFVVLSQPTGMRILFLKNKVPVLTRLITSAETPQDQATEVIRTLRHLENTHVVERVKDRFALLLLGGSQELSAKLGEDRLKLLELPKKWAVYQQSSWIHLLFDKALKKPPGQLAPLKYRVSYLAKEMSKSARIGVGVSLVAVTTLAGMSVKAALEFQTQQQQLQQQLGTITSEISNTEQEIAKFGVAPETVRKAVALDMDEIENIPSMEEHMVQVGQSLNLFPMLRLKSWRWRMLEVSEPVCIADTVPTATQLEVQTPESELEQQLRKVEIQWVIEFPSAMGPYQIEQQTIEISKKLKTWNDARLILDPVTTMKNTNITVATENQGQASRGMTWCMSVPIKTKVQP
jgi:hypothetical protein